MTSFASLLNGEYKDDVENDTPFEPREEDHDPQDFEFDDDVVHDFDSFDVNQKPYWELYPKPDENLLMLAKENLEEDDADEEFTIDEEEEEEEEDDVFTIDEEEEL